MLLNQESIIIMISMSLEDAFEIYKGEITPSLEPLERKLEAVKKALTQLDKYRTDISDQQAAIEANIHDNIGRLREVLEVRRTELIGQLHEMIQRKSEKSCSPEG